MVSGDSFNIVDGESNNFGDVGDGISESNPGSESGDSPNNVGGGFNHLDAGGHGTSSFKPGSDSGDSSNHENWDVGGNGGLGSTSGSDKPSGDPNNLDSGGHGSSKPSNQGSRPGFGTGDSSVIIGKNRFQNVNLNT